MSCYNIKNVELSVRLADWHVFFSVPFPPFFPVSIEISNFIIISSFIVDRSEYNLINIILSLYLINKERKLWFL